jgi:hypothetical protein
MDAQISSEYQSYRERFDRVCVEFQKTIAESAILSSVELKNPNDLDFTYTNSTSSFRVLRSGAAEAIADPIGLAVRDWHRKREKNQDA